MSGISSKVDRRCRFVCRILEHTPEDGFISFKELKERVSADENADVSARQVKYAIMRAISLLPAGKSATLESNGVRVSATRGSMFERRILQNQENKRRMAEILWPYLFDGTSFKSPNDVEVTEYVPAGVQHARECYNVRRSAIELWKRPLSSVGIDRKIRILRRRSSIVIALDAGSSTLAACRALLASKAIPFETFSPENSLDQSARIVSEDCARSVLPTILTNSIPLAQEISNSKYPYQINLRLIGGTERPGRRAICDAAALLWLDACQSAGTFAMIDLGIIGSTGYVEGLDDTPLAACDNGDELRLKAKLLDMSKFRIVIFDSAKLSFSEGASYFTRLTSPSVDLVVTDDGKTHGTEAEVERMCDTLTANGVAVLVASGSPKR